MKIELVTTQDYTKTKEYAEKQQAIDAILVLSKLLELDANIPETKEKSRNKISQLIDKL